MDASGARLVQRERPTKQITAIGAGAMGRNERVGACYSADGAPFVLNGNVARELMQKRSLSLDGYSKLTSPEPDRWTILVDGLPLIRTSPEPARSTIAVFEA
jgi:hypothetical protein